MSNAHSVIVVVVGLSCQHTFISPTQNSHVLALEHGVCDDEFTDSDSDTNSDVLALEHGACDDEFTDSDSDANSDVLALEDGAGTDTSNQLPVPDSAVMATPGT